MKTLKKQIIQLRKLGYSYRKIQTILACSRSTISYYCGKKQKHKKNIRQRKRRSISVLRNKVESFKCRRYTKNIQYPKDKRHIRKILQIKLRQFSMNKKTQIMKQEFSVQDLIDKIGENSICYLTGRSINLSDGRSYHLDHIVPISKGGDNSLDNCGLACKEANQAKHNLSKDEFIKLCEEVVAKSQA